MKTLMRNLGVNVGNDKTNYERVWGEKDVASCMTMERGYWTSAPPLIFNALNNCNNWRGINLLSVPSKILAIIIIQPIANTVDR